MKVWICVSTTFFGSIPCGFSSKKKAVDYVESIIDVKSKEDNGDMVIYVEDSNDEDVYIFGVNIK